MLDDLWTFAAASALGGIGVFALWWGCAAFLSAIGAGPESPKKRTGIWD